MNLIYPTASHPRFQHILGVFTNVVRYCKALYNDPINPLFKQIMTEGDLKAVLLASLFHDLGHYPLSHDLEEAESEMFSHKQITIDLLEGKIKFPGIDKLIETISNPKDWGVNPQRVANIIKADPKDFKYLLKDRILHTLIDGPIDADKLDYLIRDSEMLNVPFGKAIDYDRLIRCLTIIYNEQNRNLYAVLGIHEKGKIPAETIAFARYAMFGAVYWHHTSRAAKAMLHRAIWESLPPKGKIKAKRDYKSDLIKFIFGSGNLERRQEKLFKGLEVVFPESSELIPTDRELLKWIASRTSESGKEIINLLISRDLYKRILVISNSRNSELWKKLIKYRKDADSDTKLMIELQNDIEKEIAEDVRKVDDEFRRTTSGLEDESINKVLELASRKILIIIDIPKKRPGSDIPLEYFPESDRREMFEEWKEPRSLEDSVIWDKLHEHFLESVGKIRVFCHPDARNTILAAIKMKALEKIVSDSINKLR